MRRRAALRIGRDDEPRHQLAEQCERPLDEAILDAWEHRDGQGGQDPAELLEEDLPERPAEEQPAEPDAEETLGAIEMFLKGSIKSVVCVTGQSQGVIRG